MTCSGYAKKSGWHSCQRCWAKEDDACHKMLQSVTRTSTALFYTLWQAEGGTCLVRSRWLCPLQLWTKPEDSHVYTLVTMCLDWSTQSHTACDAVVGGDWRCLGQFQGWSPSAKPQRAPCCFPSELGQGLPYVTVPARTAVVPNTWLELAFWEDSYLSERTLCPTLLSLFANAESI